MSLDGEDRTGPATCPGLPLGYFCVFPNAIARASPFNRLGLRLKILNPVAKLRFDLWCACDPQQFTASLGQRSQILSVHAKPSPFLPVVCLVNIDPWSRGAGRDYCKILPGMARDEVAPQTIPAQHWLTGARSIPVSMREFARCRRSQTRHEPTIASGYSGPLTA